MANEHSNIKERSRSDINSPGKYKVVFHNDDFTPMEFVIAVLTNIFFKNLGEATHLMLKVHNEGKAVVGIYSYDIATSKGMKATSIARDNGYPLKISVEAV